MAYRRIQKTINTKASTPITGEVIKISIIVIGAALAAMGLELFLVPNGFLDGGVVGIAIILSSFLPHVPLGAFIGVINIPFIILALRSSGKRAAFRTTIGIAALSFGTVLLHHVEPISRDTLTALASGGALVGAGVGLALKYGGALDGMETLAVTIADKFENINVANVLLFLNMFIFIAAAFIFTPESAIKSFLLFYLVVAPLINKVVTGDKEGKIAEVTSFEKEKVIKAISASLPCRRIIIDTITDVSGNEINRFKVYLLRAQEATFLDNVRSADPDSNVIMYAVESAHGDSFAVSNSHH